MLNEGLENCAQAGFSPAMHKHILVASLVCVWRTDQYGKEQVQIRCTHALGGRDLSPTAL